MERFSITSLRLKHFNPKMPEKGFQTHKDRNVSLHFQKKIFLLKFLNFWLFFLDFLAILLNIGKIVLLEGKLRLRGCLAIYLIFQENPGSVLINLLLIKKYYAYIFKIVFSPRK